MGIATAIIGFALFLFAQPTDPVGKWDCTATTPNGENVPFRMTVTRQDGKLAIALRAADRPEFTVPDAKLEGDTLVFSVTVSDGRFSIRMKIGQDTLEGEWRGNDESGKMKGKRG